MDQSLSQGKIQSQGNVYLKDKFPDLSFTLSATFRDAASASDLPPASAADLPPK